MNTMDFRALILIIAAAACAGCGEAEDNLNAAQQPVAGVEVTPAEVTIKEGETYALKGRILNWNATAGRVLAWSSADESTATVSQEGLVTGTGVGSAEITASVEGKSASCLVTVVSSRIPAESMEITPGQLKLKTGGSALLTAKPYPENTTDRFSWSSSDPSVASVDENGRVTATGTGYAEITARAGDAAASIKVLAHGDLYISQLDPLTKPVSLVDFGFETDTVRVARGETAVLQFIAKAETAQGTVRPSVTEFAPEGQGGMVLTPKIWWVRDVRASEHWDSWAGGPPPSRYPAEQSMIPDALMPPEDWTVTMGAGDRTAFWAEFDIPGDMQPGLYRGVAALDGNGHCELPFFVQVYDVRLPEKQTLDVMHWINGDISAMNGGVSADMDLVYDRIEKVIVPFVSRYGTNCFNTQYFQRYGTNPRIVRKDGKYVMEADFSRLGAEIEMYLRACPDLHCIQGGNVVSSRTGMTVVGYEVDGSGELAVTDNGDGTYTPKSVYVQQLTAGHSPEAEAYFSRYFAALQEYLESHVLPDGRTWLDIYVQTLYDEPTDDEAEAYGHLASYVRKGAPKLRIMEPLNTRKISPEALDIPAPGLMYLEGEEGYGWTDSQTRWIYHAMGPQGNGMNRFIRIPLLPTRLIHWLNWRYRTTGFLHWGLNYWAGARNGDPWTDAGGDFPAGDMWIIWPGDGKVYPSIRLAAMRDGIRDYELLKMLFAKSGSDADALCREAVSTPYDYTTDVKEFRALRKRLLESLE